MGCVLDDGYEALLKPFYNKKGPHDPISLKEDKWQLLPAFLKVKGLVKQHVDSYNFFVEHDIKEIVRTNSIIRSDVQSGFYLEFTDIRVEWPTRDNLDDGKDSSNLTPSECRLRDMTYAAPVVVDIAYTREKKRIIRRNVPLCRIPVMLKSSRCYLSGATNAQMEVMDECPLDPGGYFVVKGTEKVLLIQEQLSKNRVIVEADDKKGVYTASVTSSTRERKSRTSVVCRKEDITLHHNIFVDKISIAIILRAMTNDGVSDSQLVDMVTGSSGGYIEQIMHQNFHNSKLLGVRTQQNALEFVGSRVKMGRGKYPPGPQSRRSNSETGLDALANIIAAHIPVEGADFSAKAIYLALMTRRVLQASKNGTLVDDRDYVGNKRFELAGALLAVLFEDLFKKFLGETRFHIDKFFKKPHKGVAFDPLHTVSSQGRHIGMGMNNAIQTGNWIVKRFNMHKVGVSHVLSRLSYIAALGMMTRIMSQFEKSRKVSGPRALHLSQWGMMCPSDTPEGEACGLVKNLALMTHITTRVDEEPIKLWVDGWSMDSAKPTDFKMEPGVPILGEGDHVIFLNGTPYGVTDMPEALARDLRHARRTGALSPFVSVHVNELYSAVHIATDEGRICRPYYIVQGGKPLVEPAHLEQLRDGTACFDDFLTMGVVEYLDVNEENDVLCAMYEGDCRAETTHMEIEPFSILGAVAGLIPFPHHNQSPRNTYQCAMGKQAIGAMAYNQLNRIDTLQNTLVYPQRPLVSTKTSQLVHYDKLPAGQNATVVVMSFSGYDIEDALVLNKASCDRGFGRSQTFRKHTVEMQRYHNGRAERVGGPELDTETGMVKAKHAALESDGLAAVGGRIQSGEVMVKKESPPTNMLGITSMGPPPENVYNDSSLSYRISDASYINKVMVSQTERDTLLVKVQTRQTRRPEIGDKFSSRHGQKGVVGIIVDQEDMPFSDSGLVPDIIMNPHGFPSRMTVGKLLECLTGKAAVLAGDRSMGRGDAFRDHPVEEMGRVLIEHGFCWHGKDYFTSGTTGEPIEAYIFNGPIYYQRLKHMVQDKMHARSHGPRAILTRQPTEGRSREGGLRVGEMERDCLVAYGGSQLLRERLMLSSDVTRVEICENCGLFGYKGYCQTCKATKDITAIDMPYGSKLLVQELLSMNVGVRLELTDEFPHPEPGVRSM